MTVRDLAASVRKHWFLVIACVIIGGGVLGVLSMLSTPMYRSSSSLYFSMTVGQSATDLNQGQTYTQSQMVSFAQLAVLPVVLDPVIEELGLDTSAAGLARSISASIPQNSVILDIAAVSPSAQEATDIVNAVAAQLVRVVAEVAPSNAASNETAVVARVVKEGTVPSFAYAPNTKRNVGAGAAAGLLAGLLFAYLRDALDTRVRSGSDVTAALGVPVLGSVTRQGGRRVRVDTVAVGAAGPHVEEFRRLRTNLEFLAVNGASLSIVVSSALSGEGKSSTCANLALSLSETDKRVLVIEADLHRPQIAARFGLESAVGLTTVLIGGVPREDATQRWSKNVDVITAGAIPPNPGELLGSQAMAELLASVRDEYDVVLIDSPPVLPLADAVVLSRLVTGVILLADTRRVRVPQLRDTGESIRAAGGHLLGVVLFRSKQRPVAENAYEQLPDADVPKRSVRDLLRRRRH
ncbi:MAG: polysaccharide biosynthesis tyrosine autokinase [Cellulomonadaceae bacterium]